MSSWTVNGVSFNAGFNIIPELVDLMNEFDSQGLWTLDDDQLIITGGSTANEYGNMEILQLSSGQIGILDANAKFVPFSVALDIEEGPNSIVVTQVETGCQDSILVFVECLEVNVTPDTIEVVIELGTDTLICFDPSELTAPIATVESYCEDVSTEIVNYDISNNCVNISAEFIGDDIGCFVYCDENDICDTLVIFSIVVTEGSIVPPVAMDDDTVTIVNWHIQNFDITQNDTFDISNDSLAIILEPHYGTVDLNFDFTINYIPDEDFCGEIDSFMYMIVSPHGTDIATVYIDILCEDITIFNGFSPNGDSVNESFVITGIESFENNRVVIFNRWGKQVYYKENYTYENGWDGTWEGNHLPDGTYFYLIDVGDNRQFSGYVQIHR